MPEALLTNREEEVKDESIQRKYKLARPNYLQQQQTMLILQKTELETETKMPCNQSNMQQLRKEGPFCMDMQTKKV